MFSGGTENVHWEKWVNALYMTTVFYLKKKVFSIISDSYYFAESVNFKTCDIIIDITVN